jgi:hypothetical protein
MHRTLGYVEILLALTVVLALMVPSPRTCQAISSATIMIAAEAAHGNLLSLGSPQ